MSDATRSFFEQTAFQRIQGGFGGNGPAEGFDSLRLAVERIRLRGYRRVLWQRHLWVKTGQYPAQGLAIPHEEIDIACMGLDHLAEEKRFYRSDAQAREISDRIGNLEKHGPEDRDGRFEHLKNLFSLSGIEADFLTLCIAPEIDPRFRRLYGYLHDDVAFCGPTPWLAKTLFEWQDGVRLTSNAALIRWLLAYPGLNEEQPWSAMARWMADPRIVAYLLGSDDFPPSLQTAAQWIESEEHPAFEPAAVEPLRNFLAPLRRSVLGREPRAAQLIGAEGVGRKTWTAWISGEKGLKLLCLDAPQLLATETKEAKQVDGGVRERIVRAEREALLHECILYWNQADKTAPEVWRQLSFAAPVQLFGVEQPIRMPSNVPHADLIPFALPTPEQALTLWQRLLPQVRDDFDVPELVERFTLTPAEIKAVAGKAEQGREELWTACRDFSRGRLGKLATLLPCPFTWEDIVLPADTARHLREIASHAVHRSTVYNAWGFGKKRPLGRGVSALFAGYSGTGKTMAAQVLAAEMGVVLFRIDLASVVSKYVGETEKNLREIFDEAERLNAVIFFDEADALFGRRTEVKDAHDRYANIEVNYLLQRMESYEGLAILATNRKGDIDSAFLRRLRFIVEFPMPGVKERAAIWRLALPEQATDGTALLGEINFDLLARRLEITGASIKDIALGAAFLACGEGRKIGMEHLIQAARRELAKHGRLISKEEFGGDRTKQANERKPLTKGM